MRTETINIYKYDELPSEEAKETARDAFRGWQYHWSDASRESIEIFCEAFNVKLLDYSVVAYCPIDYKTNASSANFRGKRLSQFNREHTPTGYCLDNDLWITFYDVFKTTGNAKHAFNEALSTGFKTWREDMEYQTTDEYIDDFILANEFEFYENGKPYH